MKIANSRRDKNVVEGALKRRDIGGRYVPKVVKETGL
jgi:hypothetical protein